jgi:uncharacterized integral membrane protein (TIGR00697 family)
MVPQPMLEFFSQNQSLLWVITVCFDLGLTLVMFRCFGKAGLYTVIVLNAVLCNIQALKLTHVFGANTSLGVILYSGIFFATDLLSERYGKREAGRAVIIGFSANVVMVVVMSMTLMFEPTTHGAEKTIAFASQAHSALSTLFRFTPIIVFGSMVAYLVSQTHDVWFFHMIKKKTQGRHLWLRNTASTLVSQAIDTAIFGLIVWAPTVGLREAMGIAAFKYIFKFVIAVLDTPFIYWARTWNVRDRDWGYSTDTEVE